MDAKWSDKQVEDIRKRCTDLCRECGVVVRYTCLNLDAGYSRVGRVDIYYRGDVTFDALAKIAEAFGTRDINLSCDCGTGSDPCHNSTIYVNNPTVDLFAAVRRGS